MAEQRVVCCLLMALGVLLLCQPAVTKNAKKCTQTAECYYDCGDVVMDLKPLTNHTFKNVADKLGQNKFSYSACGTFTEGDGCHNTHVCQITEYVGNASFIDVGSTETPALFPSGGPSSLNYSHTTPDGTTRWTIVMVKCASPNDTLASDPQLTVDGEDPNNLRHYLMTLTSKHACFQAKGKTTPITPKPVTTAERPNVTTPATTHHTTHDKVTTQHHNVTSAMTTAHHGNATTEMTTAGHNTTTAGGNTTANATTEVTTSAATKVTTHAMPTSETNGTTAHHTTPGHGPHTTNGHMSTTHSSAANKPRSETAVLAVLMSAVITLACL